MANTQATAYSPQPHARGRQIRRHDALTLAKIRPPIAKCIWGSKPILEPAKRACLALGKKEGARSHANADPELLETVLALAMSGASGVNQLASKRKTWGENDKTNYYGSETIGSK